MPRFKQVIRNITLSKEAYAGGCRAREAIILLMKQGDSIT